jgi:cytochrome c peroxidase
MNVNQPKSLTTQYAVISSIKFTVVLLILTALAGCSSGGSDSSSNDTVDDSDTPVVIDTPAVDPSDEQDQQLREIISAQSLTGNPAAGIGLPDINDPLPQLGKLLFFSKSLGGDFDSACVTCHHPTLGGGDELSLPVGVGANDPDLLGLGRVHKDGIPLVPRNSPTIFNVGLWQTSLFWDSRIESLTPDTNSPGAIRTPDSDFDNADNNAGPTLAAAQARFPVTSVEEMKAEDFEAGSDNETIRAHLAGRVGNYGSGVGELASTTWVAAFQQAFNSTAGAEALVTFDNIALALGEYERSMVFVNNPWRAYVEGDNTALSDNQKAGAILFLTNVNEGGAGCVACHSGDTFSDGLHHTVAFPQIGPGKGDGLSDVLGNTEDFGRERETGDNDDRYRFRTASLLNVAVTAPFSHAGAYNTLRQVVDHYDNPTNEVNDYFDDGGWCQLPQFASIDDCQDLYPRARANSQLVLQRLNRDRDSGVSVLQNPQLGNQESNNIVSFLESLTDPCVVDRECVKPWITDPVSPGPDGQQLNARDGAGDFL